MNEQIDEVSQLLKVNNRKARGNIRIESDVLEPQQSSQSYATFNIRRAGILSNDSRLVLPLYASNVNTRLTMLGGAFAMIRNAVLRTSSGTVLASSQDINYLASIKNQFRSQEVRDKAGRYENGTWNVWNYGIGATAANGAGKYRVGSLLDLDGTNYDQHHRDRLGSSAADATEYSISFKNLFPEMFPVSFPVYALEDSLQLFLEFAEQGVTGDVAVSSTGTATDVGSVLIDLNKLRFISDHIFMDQPVMDKLYAMTKTSQGLQIPYADYNLVKMNRIAPAAPAANLKTTLRFQNSIGMSGLRIKHILIHNSEASANGHPTSTQSIAGKYACADSYSGEGGQSVQLQIDNSNYYNQDLVNSHFYRELEDCFGVAMSCPYPAYTTIGAVTDGTLGDGNVKYTLADRAMIMNDTVFSVVQDKLVGSSNVIGINFTSPLNRPNNGTNGKLIGSAPVQLTYQRDFTATQNDNLLTRVFICASRVMVIQNGVIVNNYS